MLKNTSICQNQFHGTNLKLKLAASKCPLTRKSSSTPITKNTQSLHFRSVTLDRLSPDRYPNKYNPDPQLIIIRTQR